MGPKSPLDTIISFVFDLFCLWRPRRPSREGERNIVILGSLGVGKSSLVNMIIGRDVAPVSDAVGVAHKAVVQHAIPLSEIFGGPNPPRSELTLCIYDTVGLEHRPSPWVAIKSGLKRCGGVDLVMYCTRRGRLTHEQGTHLRDIWNTFCHSGVPLVLVVSGVDYRHGSTERWWEENNDDLANAAQVRFADHICLNTWESAHPSWKHQGTGYEEAQRLVRDLVVRYCGSPRSVS